MLQIIKILLNYLNGSYRRYKEYTNLFAIWLYKIASNNGYSRPSVPKGSNPPPSSTKLKGKAKMAAKKAGTPIKVTTIIKLSTKEILAQATLVGNAKPPVIMPLSIQTIF
jgi:hypothetical protein